MCIYIWDDQNLLIIEVGYEKIFQTVADGPNSKFWRRTILRTTVHTAH